jgi:hypothetical protein
LFFRGLLDDGHHGEGVAVLGGEDFGSLVFPDQQVFRQVEDAEGTIE